MAKTIYEAMKKSVEKTLDGVPLDLLSISNGETTNEETGEISKFIRCEVEVPMGFDALSRCRFTVKILNGKMLITDDQITETPHAAKFSGLTISFIDNRANVYFKADDYVVVKMEGKA